MKEIFNLNRKIQSEHQKNSKLYVRETSRWMMSQNISILTLIKTHILFIFTSLANDRQFFLLFLVLF